MQTNPNYNQNYNVQQVFENMLVAARRRAEIGKFNLTIDLRREIIADPSFATKFVANASRQGFLTTNRDGIITVDWGEKAFHRQGSIVCELFDISCEKQIDEIRLRDDFLDLLGNIRDNKKAMSIDFDIAKYAKVERRWFMRILFQDGFHVRRNKDILTISWTLPISERTMNLVYG